YPRPTGQGLSHAPLWVGRFSTHRAMAGPNTPHEMPLQDTRDPLRVQPGKAEAMPHCGWVASAPTAQWQDQTPPKKCRFRTLGTLSAFNRASLMPEWL
ncbi:hypothetical protein, partial [Puniceicoccus vermicola]|uniref:hypothetical protein n=1 Tax=Puniceicoccus vermicola TaxID=388746 RepID=UPI001C8BC363